MGKVCKVVGIIKIVLNITKVRRSESKGIFNKSLETLFPGRMKITLSGLSFIKSPCLIYLTITFETFKDYVNLLQDVHEKTIFY